MFRALAYHANAIQMNRIRDIEDITLKFLQVFKNARLMQNKFLSTYKAIKKAQETWREYKKRKEAFQICMLMLWEKSYKMVFENHINELPKSNPRVMITQISKQA